MQVVVAPKPPAKKEVATEEGVKKEQGVKEEGAEAAADGETEVGTLAAPAFKWIRHT